MNNSIMNNIGSMVFIGISSKLHNDSEKYLKFLNYDRIESIDNAINNVGVNPHEYRLLFVG